MSKPAPYSNTDSAENRAVAIFQYKIDSDYIKADVKTRDKYPNIDGTVEIVDDDNVPLGKIEVQIRAIPSGTRKYSCPSSLVAYSDVSTLPVVLVCVDVSNEMIYWRSMSSSMPEHKAGQDSFTITFDPDVDQVDATNLYITRWMELASDYQECIARYPSLREKVENEFGLTNVTASKVVFFQRLADTLNNLLDIDFVAFKRALFPGTWKLGVGIIDVSSDVGTYLLYRIPYGENSPILSKFEGSLFELLKDVPNSFIAKDVDTSEIQNATEEGHRLALEFVMKAVKRRLLTVHGRLLAQELLFWFIDRFWFCLGLEKSDVYLLSDVSLALNRYLPLWYSKAQEYLGSQTMDFEMVVTSLRPAELERIRSEAERAVSENAPVPLVRVFSDSLSFRAIFESLEYLRAISADQIHRLYIPRSEDLMKGNFIWSGYDAEGLKHNIDLILTGSIDEYREFVSANNIVLEQSDYLGDEKAFVLAFDYQGCIDGGRNFWLTKLVVDNPNNRLEKVTIVDKSIAEAVIQDRERQTIRIDGYDYKIISGGQEAGTELFSETPILDRVYSMLKEDLQLNYDLRDLWNWL